MIRLIQVEKSTVEGRKQYYSLVLGTGLHGSKLAEHKDVSSLPAPDWGCDVTSCFRPLPLGREAVTACTLELFAKSIPFFGCGESEDFVTATRKITKTETSRKGETLVCLNTTILGPGGGHWGMVW